MQTIFTFTVESDGTRMFIKLDAKVDPLVAVGLLEQAKQKVLHQAESHSGPPQIASAQLQTIPLNPKRF